MLSNRVKVNLFATGWLVSAIVAAAAFRQWRGKVRAVEEQLGDARRTSEAEARRAAAEERLRIARDLHDSLTHNISVVKVQAGVAAHLARKRGDEVPEAIQAIEQAAGDASFELRETLDVLRRDPCGPDGRGVADLEHLARRAEHDGLEVHVDVTGEARAVPPRIDRAAYRIVQESLTNVHRHARASQAWLTVNYLEGAITVEVCDDGIGHRGEPRSTGLGLVGMRERAAELGGRITVDARLGEGFRIRATLPTSEER